MDWWTLWVLVAVTLVQTWRVVRLEGRVATLALRLTLIREDLEKLKKSWGLRPVPPPERVREVTPLEFFTTTSVSRYRGSGEAPPWMGPKR